MKKNTYKSTPDGCVIEIADGCVVYEPLQGIPAKQIARAMNQLKAEGVAEEWDWKNVERRLFQLGVIKQLRA